MVSRASFYCALVIFCLFCTICEISADKKLIVVLVDGVRWDYLNDPKLKGFPRMIKNGVRAPYVIPVYPSLSYPNYQTIVTGLYPENHNFVSNLLYDNETNRFFGMIPKPGSTDQHWWNGAEPIWITAEKHGKPAALYWWAGCEVQIRDSHPTICERQRYGPPTEALRQNFLERIDDVVQMFKTPSKFPADRLSLALMYYGSVDYNGHHYGPKSAALKDALYDIDEILDKMQSKISKAGLQNDVNIMVVADHGMTEIRKKISLEKFSSKIMYQIDHGALSMLIPELGMLYPLYEDMKKENIDGLSVYMKEEIPEEYHIKHNRLIQPLYLRAEKGYYIKWLKNSRKRFGVEPDEIVATHGYDPNKTEDMRTIFVATGPDFRKGFETEVLYNTDMYNIMCTVLRVPPLANNGSFERVQSMLASNQKALDVLDSSAAAIKHYLHYISFLIVTIYINRLNC